MATYQTWQDLLDEEDATEPGAPEASAGAPASDAPRRPETIELPLELLELQAEKDRLERHLKSLTGQGEPDPAAAREAAMYPMPIFTVESRIEQRKLRRLEESLRVLARRRLEAQRIEAAAKRRNREAMAAHRARELAEQGRRRQQQLEYLRWLRHRDTQRAAQQDAERLLARARASKLRQEQTRRDEREQLDAESAARSRAARTRLRPALPRKRSPPIEPAKPTKAPTSDRPPSIIRQTTPRTKEPTRPEPPLRSDTPTPRETTPRTREPARPDPPLRSEPPTTPKTRERALTRPEPPLRSDAPTPRETSPRTREPTLTRPEPRAAKRPARFTRTRDDERRRDHQRDAQLERRRMKLDPDEQRDRRRRGEDD